MAKVDREETLGPIGARVRQRRRELNLTQEALASAAGVSKSFISEVEKGKTAASGLVYLKLSGPLQVSVEWLLTGTLPERRPAARDVTIPPFVAEVAEAEHWSYAETLDVAAALQRVVARRSLGRRWEPGRDDLVALAEALRRMRQRPDEERDESEQ